jgi:pimeloyl-ACP methyl ester carboxylesterase
MQTDSATRSRQTRYIARSAGRIAYDVDGEGPLVVLIPGMGDLRSTYRFMAPALGEAGHRVAVTDLRGHGDSDASFATYGDAETAADVVALIEELGGPAVIVGNSMGAGAAVITAAERPDLVSSIVLIGPFVRNGSTSSIKRLFFRMAMAPLWAPTIWKAYLPKLYAGRRPDDFEAYRKAVVASLRRPGYARAFSRTTHTSHDPAEASLKDVTKPTLVVMGSRDPDFPDPEAEAAWIAEALHGDVVVVPDAGHYPQSQQPDITTAAVLTFLKTIGDRA